jgi:hypothetical protein
MPQRMLYHSLIAPNAGAETIGRLPETVDAKQLERAWSTSVLCTSIHRESERHDRLRLCTHWRSLSYKRIYEDISARPAAHMPRVGRIA